MVVELEDSTMVMSETFIRHGTEPVPSLSVPHELPKVVYFKQTASH
jgi:hypothetical protein